MALKALRDIRLVAFDLDGTLLGRTVFVWQTLHEHFGSDPKQRQQAYDDFFARRICYAEWFAHDLRLLKERGATHARIREALARLHPVAGAFETLETLRRRGYRLGLISGSLDLALEQFFPGPVFDHVLINRLNFDEHGEISGGQPTPYDLEGKAEGLRELARREGLTLEQCAFVGDNFNDLPVMRVAGFSVGVAVKHPDVERVASVVISDQDLRALLPLFPDRLASSGGTT